MATAFSKCGQRRGQYPCYCLWVRKAADAGRESDSGVSYLASGRGLGRSHKSAILCASCPGGYVIFLLREMADRYIRVSIKA